MFNLMIGATDTNNYNANEWLIFVVASLLVMILLMNLLIAIISDTFEEVMSNIETSSYMQLCEIVLEQEMFYSYFNTASDHFCHDHQDNP